MKQFGAVAILVSFIGFGVVKCQFRQPCTSPVDPDCVREYLSFKSTCEPVVNGPNLDPSYVENFYLEAPTFNITEYTYNNRFLGLRNSYPVSLKVDVAACYTILTVFHPQVIFEGTIKVWFYSEGNAPYKITTTFRDTFTNFTTTTMIPGNEVLKLDSARTFTALSSPPTIVLGENVPAEMAKSALVRKTLLAVFADIPTLAAEEGLAIYPRLIKSYIGQNLCTYKGN